MAARKQEPKARIPKFSSIEGEAEFWDTHDTTEFESEFRPVDVKVAKRLSKGITIRLDPDTMKRVRELASNRGIGPTTLIRMWVVEKMNEDRQAVSEMPTSNRRPSIRQEPKIPRRRGPIRTQQE
ncbi:MAG: hypothetical protein IIC85_03245 [Chloroflexi bacterium]|nr:hypothetical protein [Chloroflexota bacterium]